ncbi:MAG: hypothetical protein AAFS13_01340 [Pseudomonadota bacterium]
MNGESQSGAHDRFDRGLIEAQLKQIIESAQFSDTTRLKRFLEYVVTETLEGRGDQIKGYSLGVDVFDKPKDFDPQADTIVRVQAKKLRTRLMIYYASEGMNDRLRIDIPKGSYKPVFTQTNRSSPTKNRRASSRSQAISDRISVAVMSLENVSGDPAQNGHAIALTEDIAAALSRFSELRVMSRALTMRSGSADTGSLFTGEPIGAQYLLGGTYARLSEKLRAIIYLLCPETGEQVFSEVFNRHADEDTLFEAHNDIADRVAAKIAEPHGFVHRAGAEERRESENLNAYDASLRAIEYWRAPSVEAHVRIREQLEIAVRDEPTYAGAWGMLSLVYTDDARFGFLSDPDLATLQSALKAAERSIQLDPLNAAGLYAMCLAQFHLGNSPAFNEMVKRALAANPNYPDMLADLSLAQAMVGDLAFARELNRRALELCPDPPGWFHSTTFAIHFVAEEYREAFEASRKIGSAFWAGAEFCEALALSALGSVEEANAKLELFLKEGFALDAFLSLHFKLWNMAPSIRKRIIALLSQLPAAQLTLDDAQSQPLSLA